jgi:hypothetical protein
MVNDTIRLKPDTVLIGLHPGVTRLVLPNGSPLYAGHRHAQGPAGKRARRRRHRDGHRHGDRRSQSARGGAAVAAGEIRWWTISASSGAMARRRIRDKKSERFDTSALHWDRQYPERLGDRWRWRHLHRRVDAGTATRRRASM